MWFGRNPKRVGLSLLNLLVFLENKQGFKHKACGERCRTVQSLAQLFTKCCFQSKYWADLNFKRFNNYFPTTNNQQPTTNNQQPTTNNQKLPTNTDA